VLWKKEDLEKVITRKKEGNLSHSLRLWEAESALELRIILSEWYKLPVIEREHIIATRLAEGLIEGLMQKEAYNSARK